MKRTFEAVSTGTPEDHGYGHVPEYIAQMVVPLPITKPEIPVDEAPLGE